MVFCLISRFRLAERLAPLPSEAKWATLVLHLIASHHGYARPFAPVSLDREPPVIEGVVAGFAITLAAEARADLTPIHRIDSGLAERFWELTRRYGWWGLAYLEAMLRLADWYGSEVVPVENEPYKDTP